MSIAVLILAAGESSRMGQPKQLLAWRGTTLLQHSIDTARSITALPIVVVLGANSEVIRLQLDETHLLVVQNDQWREGMGSSIRIGLQTALEAIPNLALALLMVCDQPFISPTTLDQLLATQKGTNQPIVASEYGGNLGVPALFAAQMFPELLALRGAGGARQLIQAHRSQVAVVAVPEAAIDIDTPAEYHSLNEICAPTPPFLL